MLVVFKSTNKCFEFFGQISGSVHLKSVAEVSSYMIVALKNTPSDNCLIRFLSGNDNAFSEEMNTLTNSTHEHTNWGKLKSDKLSNINFSASDTDRPNTRENISHIHFYKYCRWVEIIWILRNI